MWVDQVLKRPCNWQVFMPSREATSGGGLKSSQKKSLTNPSAFCLGTAGSSSKGVDTRSSLEGVGRRCRGKKAVALIRPTNQGGGMLREAINAASLDLGNIMAFPNQMGQWLGV